MNVKSCDFCLRTTREVVAMLDAQVQVAESAFTEPFVATVHICDVCASRIDGYKRKAGG